MENEKMIRNSPNPVNISETQTILNQMMNCVCKIKINSSFGTGFVMKFLLIIFQWKFLLQIITLNELNLFLNDDKEVKIMQLGEGRITYFNPAYDIAIVELKESDGITDYLELDDNLFKEETKAYYKDISIYILQYPHGNIASVS